MKFRAFVVCLFIATLALGCSGGRIPLSGTVTFEDGSPLTKGVVRFDNGKISAAAPVCEDGTWKVGMSKPGDGIIPGTYNVYISGAVLVKDTNGKGMGTKATELIDKKYTSTKTSGWSYTIDGKTKTLDLKVSLPK